MGGAEKGLADVGIWASLHNLLEHTMVEYLVVTHKFVLPKNVARGVHPGAIEAIEDGEVDDEGGDVGDQGPVLRPRDNNDKGEVDYARENRIQRDKAYRWLMTKPADRVMVMRYILDPMIVYMLSEIDAASYHWQTATLHGNVNADTIGSGRLLGERWPLLTAVEGKNDNRCMEALAQKHEDPLLHHFRDAANTIRTDHMLFKHLSRQASLVHST